MEILFLRFLRDNLIFSSYFHRTTPWRCFLKSQGHEINVAGYNRQFFLNVMDYIRLDNIKVSLTVDSSQTS